MHKRPMATLTRAALVASAAMLASCINMQAIHPDDIVQKTPPTSSIVIFSTFSKSQCLGFCLAIVLYHVTDGGKLEPVPGERYTPAYYLGHPHNPPDIPSANVNIDWHGLPPGKYALTVGAFNPHECILTAPEYYFSTAPGQTLYLGELHRAGGTLELRGHYSRDVGYFRAHTIGAGAVEVLPATVTIKNVNNFEQHKIICRSVFEVSLADPHGTPAGASLTIAKN